MGAMLLTESYSTVERRYDRTSGKPMPDSGCGGRGARGYIEFGVDVCEMGGNGAPAEVECFRDLGVRVAFDE